MPAQQPTQSVIIAAAQAVAAQEPTATEIATAKAAIAASSAPKAILKKSVSHVQVPTASQFVRELNLPSVSSYVRSVEAEVKEKWEKLMPKASVTPVAPVASAANPEPPADCPCRLTKTQKPEDAPVPVVNEAPAKPEAKPEENLDFSSLLYSYPFTFVAPLSIAPLSWASYPVSSPSYGYTYSSYGYGSFW